jgi:hypothetical protein
MDDDTFNRIRLIIAADLEIAASTVMLPTSFIDDLYADSLDMIELIMAFEGCVRRHDPGHCGGKHRHRARRRGLHQAAEEDPAFKRAGCVARPTGQ